MFRKMVSLLLVESLVAISSKDSGGDKLVARTEKFEFQE